MTLGVQGTGPYGEIKNLRYEIGQCKYELRLIADGLQLDTNSRISGRLNGIIRRSRARIRELLNAEKAEK